MRAFVTGATGLLGSNLVRALVWDGWKIRALVRSMERARRRLHDPAIDYILGDLRDAGAFAHELNGCDVLFHAARASGLDAKADHAINVRGTVHLLTAAKRAGVPVAVRLSCAGAPSATDVAVERWRLHNPDTRVVTIASALFTGPNESRGSELGRIMSQALVEGRAKLSAEGLSLVDARDVAAAMIQAAGTGVSGTEYAVGGRFYAAPELCSAMGRATAADIRLRRPALPAWLTRRRAPAPVNSERAVLELGVSFRSLDETLSDAADSLRASIAAAARPSSVAATRGFPAGAG